MKDNRILSILEEIYKIHDFNLYDVVAFILDHLRKLEDLLNRKLSKKEIFEGINSALLYLISNEKKKSSKSGG